jgi:hypothetical protein
MNVHNILMDQGKITGIIDFCDTRHSDLEIDLNPLLVTDSAFYEAFMKRYIACGGKAPNAKAVYLLGAIRSLSGSIWNREAGNLEKSVTHKKRGVELAHLAMEM